MERNRLFNRHSIIRSLIVLFSLSLVFISGYFSTNARIEETSFYSSEVVKNNTIAKQTISLSVRSKGDSGSLPNWDNEFHNLYGAFKERVITFAATINSDKAMNLMIKDDVSYVTDSISLLCTGAVGTIEYPTNKPTHFKHHSLPIEMMFEDNRSIYDINHFIVNISQSHANKMLANKGIVSQADGNYTKEQYETLIRTECLLVKDNNQDQAFKMCINNIFLENDNYYVNGLHETINDFVMVSYYLPWDLRNHQENCYFLTDSAFQNAYFMRYINNVYGLNKYDISLIKNNLVGDVDELKLLSFNTSVVSSLNWLSILLLSISIIGFGLLCFDSIRCKAGIKNFLLEFCCLIIPYLIFFVVFKITNILLIFSSFSCLSYTFIIGIYIFILFVSSFIKKQMKVNKFGGSFDEVHI